MRRVGVQLGMCLALAAAPARAEEPLPATLSEEQAATLEVVEQGVLSTLSTTPYGAPVAVVWTVSELTRQVGLAATEREDKLVGAELILIDSYARELKALDKTTDLRTDPRAQFIKARLRELSLGMGDRGQSDTSYLLRITQKHFEYALARVAVTEVAANLIGRRVTGLLGRIPLPRSVKRAWAKSVHGLASATPADQRRGGLPRALGWASINKRERAIVSGAAHFWDGLAARGSGYGVDTALDYAQGETALTTAYYPQMTAPVAAAARAPQAFPYVPAPMAAAQVVPYVPAARAAAQVPVALSPQPELKAIEPIVTSGGGTASGYTPPPREPSNVGCSAGGYTGCGVIRGGIKWD